MIRAWPCFLKEPGDVLVPGLTPSSFSLMEERAVIVHGEELLCSGSLWGEVNAPPAGLKLMDWQCSSC